MRTSTEICPDRIASTLGRSFFTYASRLMTQGYREKLTYDHAWGLDQRNHPEKLLTAFESDLPPEHLRDSSKKWIPWLFISLMKSTSFFVTAGMLTTVIFGAIVMADPIFLKVV
ncbi:hypothetical protein FO519_010201, partial [Halicephalobus sp. NKZ332]